MFFFFFCTSLPIFFMSYVYFSVVFARRNNKTFTQSLVIFVRLSFCWWEKKNRIPPVVCFSRARPYATARWMDDLERASRRRAAFDTSVPRRRRQPRFYRFAMHKMRFPRKLVRAPAARRAFPPTPPRTCPADNRVGRARREFYNPTAGRSGGSVTVSASFSAYDTFSFTRAHTSFIFGFIPFPACECTTEEKKNTLTKTLCARSVSLADRRCARKPRRYSEEICISSTTWPSSFTAVSETKRAGSGYVHEYNKRARACFIHLSQ